MRVLRYLGSFIFASAMLSGVSSAPAQVSVNIGVAPVCPYGYFPYAPYDCAPYGYYGPDWFTGGIFIGAGPLVSRASWVLWPRRPALRSSPRLPWTAARTRGTPVQRLPGKRGAR